MYCECREIFIYYNNNIYLLQMEENILLVQIITNYFIRKRDRKI